ncbi:TPA: hypothetical protein HA273_00140 [Candidatus Bathyarchaeota archaeon]|nr:hypothetical protein [Candidatus Bathyarchaeota archaeon]
MHKFTDEIGACRDCTSLSGADRLNMEDKPFVFFNVEEKWQSKEGVKVLFIAESPPWNGKQSYFYNEAEDRKSTNLRKEVCKYLNLSLDQFRDEGYLLLDSIKCRLNKQNKKKVPREILKTCSAKFLSREIKSLKPKTIFVLGNSAKKALQGMCEIPEFSEFGDLAGHKITEDYEKDLSKFHIILSVYPGGQTRKYESNIRRAFLKITHEAPI